MGEKVNDFGLYRLFADYGGAMRVELVQRLQERALPRLVLPDHAGKRVEQLDFARVFDIPILPHAEGFQLHDVPLSGLRPFSLLLRHDRLEARLR